MSHQNGPAGGGALPEARCCLSQELPELFAQGALSLSAAEAKQVLSLRVEFRKESIEQLLL